MKRSKIIFACLTVLALFLLRATTSTSTSAETLTEADILALLPEGAKLADDIPIVQATGPTGEEKQRQECIYYADVDSDDENEIIVAYYYSPPPPENATEGQKITAAEKACYCRSHVRVLDWDGEKYVTQWDDGGCGQRFLATIAHKGKPVPEEDRPYALNAFSVRDITGDGKPEILTTVPYYGTLIFTAWSWDGTAYKKIADVPFSVRIEDVDNDGVEEILLDKSDRGRPLDRPIVFKWDGQSYKAEEEEAWRKRFFAED